MKSLRYLRLYSPTCFIGLLLHEWRPDWEEDCLLLNCVSVHVNNDILTEEMAKKVKSMNKLLLCYTVNDPERAKTLYHWGVDAVFSDVPDRIIAFGLI
jgi:glycerophosphoryl diester phosphodiesterase